MIRGGVTKPRLLVLDNDRYQKLFDAILGEDFELLPTNNTSEAIKLARAASPDLILVSNSLENTEGISIVREIRKSASATVPILLVLSTDQPTLRRQAEQEGCSGFLIKPIDPDKLKSQIESWLNRPVERQAESA